MNAIQYYLRTSERRKILDKLSSKYSYLYEGIVLDIGGRDKGKFNKPKQKVKKWIFADIETKHNPDIQLDVSDMNHFNDESIDIINAMELFEHVKKINSGISECYRILKNEGKMILSVPFLHRIHADPYDYQRWTLDKWIIELEKTGFIIETRKITGLYFTVLTDFRKAFIQSLPIVLRYPFYLYYPIFDILKQLDNLKIVKQHKRLGSFHGGYFFILKKQKSD